MGYKNKTVTKTRQVQKQRQIPNGSGGFTMIPYWDTETYTTTESVWEDDTSSSSYSSYDSSSYSSGGE